jgi:two-component system NtrC family sensor kinase
MAGETVLIIEDRRENIVHLANNVLKPNGYQILTAMDGQRGLKRILADQPDLVIMDLNMPKMDGLEVLAALQERNVDVPVILTTFYGSEQVAEQALRLGAVDYVVKPYEVEDMLRAVKKALAGRPAAAPRPAREPEEVMPLTRQVERWMRDMNILNRVGKALVAQLEMERVCSRTVEAAIYVTRADHAFLFLGDAQDDQELALRAARGPENASVRFFDQAMEGGLATQVVRSGQTVRRSSSANETELVDVASSLLGPLLATPLRWQRKTYGALLVARSPGEVAFSEADAEWLSGLAEYVAIAVRNAQICEEGSSAPGSTPDKEMLHDLRSELDRLAAQLAAASATLSGLSSLLAGEEADNGG